jgi:hypothetical protein
MSIIRLSSNIYHVPVFKRLFALGRVYIDWDYPPYPGLSGPVLYLQVCLQGQVDAETIQDYLILYLQVCLQGKVDAETVQDYLSCI